MSWDINAPEGNETSKVHDRISPFVSGHGVDLGCGCWKLKVEKSREHSCVGVDGGYSPVALTQADIIADVSDLNMFKDEAFDYVYSSHTLEDMPYTEAILREWWRLVKPGGNLILYLPLTRRVAKEMGLENWADFYPNIGEPGVNVYHKQDFHPQTIRDLIASIGDAEVLADEVRGEKEEYSFLQVYRKLSSSSAVPRGIQKTNGKRALVVRYGAIGDFIQTTPVLRKLKEEGYHVTVNCSETAKEVLKYSPYVDELVVQIRDYVPNQGVVSGPLFEYWKELATKYDKFVNLTGAAEETLLVPDSRLMVMMDQIGQKHPELNEQNRFYNSIRSVQAQVGDTNYYDNHLAKAGYSDRGMNGELFFSEQEEIMAQGFRDKYPGRFIVMWVLSGSSYHKRYPYFQQAAQELIIKNPDILLVSVGDPECALLERSESNRYLPRAGRWLLRTTLVMTKYVDLVIGPETGIMNAAGCFDTPKITMLSHSSHDNLCKYWKNDFCVAPDVQDVFCHPCHVLHYIHTVNQECPTCKGSTHSYVGGLAKYPGQTGGLWTCPYEIPESLKDKTGLGAPSPICTTRLGPEKVLARIDEVYRLWRGGRRTVPQPLSVAVGA
jgi:ADP-heptose:LPS heptosyltransferase/predicted SAM-dependent methyltransferase